MDKVSTAVSELVADVVDEFALDNKTFTAYDVTKEVRNRTEEEFLHGQVREYIHQIMKSLFPLSYKKTTNQQFGCIQYEPLTNDTMKIQQDKPYNQGGSTVKTSDSTLVVPQSFQDAIDQHFNELTLKQSSKEQEIETKPIKTKGTLVQDSEGRLGIPKAEIARLAKNNNANGDIICVLHNKVHNTYGFFVGQPSDVKNDVFTVIKTYYTDHHGSARIPKSTLKKMGVPLGRRYKLRMEYQQLFIDVV